MNHTPNSSDNLFLRGHASLRSKHLKLSGALMLLALAPLLVMFILLLWLSQFQLQRDIATQADQTGSELARQIATLVADPLAANDTLSLNIILAQWAQSPMVAHTSLTSTEKRIVAEAGRKPSADNLAPGQGRFVAAVHFQEKLIGELHLSLARAPFTAPSAGLVQGLLWSLVLLMIVAGLIAWRWGVGMRRVLAGLGNWYGDTGIAPPGLRRPDELGDLARRLAERRITDLPPLPEPEPEPEPELEPAALDDVLLDEPSATAELDSLADEHSEPLIDEQNNESEEPRLESPVAATELPQAAGLDTLDADAASVLNEQLPELPETPVVPAPASAILAIRLGNQHTLHRLPRPRLLGLLERYREQLDQASRACGGQLHTLLDGTSLIFFHPQQADQLGDALFCGELMRVLGHELQIQIADTGIALHVQIALCHTPCQDIAPDELQEQSTNFAQMLEHMQHSRNLLLLDAELATNSLLNDKVVVRRLASQPGIYCVERLKEPYQTQLERHLKSLSKQ